jgi:hypothetical protein
MIQLRVRKENIIQPYLEEIIGVVYIPTCGSHCPLTSTDLRIAFPRSLTSRTFTETQEVTQDASGLVTCAWSRSASTTHCIHVA